MYKAVTDGKFGEALRQVNTILAIIPLTVVNTRHEVDELKEVISIARCAVQYMELDSDFRSWQECQASTKLLPVQTSCN